MANDVNEEIENALNTIAPTTERSGNMKKELKHTIYETVSTLRKVFFKLIDKSEGKSSIIKNWNLLWLLRKQSSRVLETKQQRDRQRHLAPPVATGCWVASTGAWQAKLFAGMEQPKL